MHLRGEYDLVAAPRARSHAPNEALALRHARAVAVGGVDQVNAGRPGPIQECVCVAASGAGLAKLSVPRPMGGGS